MPARGVPLHPAFEGSRQAAHRPAAPPAHGASPERDVRARTAASPRRCVDLGGSVRTCDRRIVRRRSVLQPECDPPGPPPSLTAIVWWLRPFFVSLQLPPSGGTSRRRHSA